LNRCHDTAFPRSPATDTPSTVTITSPARTQSRDVRSPQDRNVRSLPLDLT
jgi:hypothetical protein